MKMKMDKSDQVQSFLSNDAAETSVVPRDKFPFWLSYFFNEYIHQRFGQITGGVFIFICIFASISTYFKSGAAIFIACVYFLVLLMAVVIGYVYELRPNFKLRELNSQSQMKLLLEVIECKPTPSSSTWDVIACHVNEYLYTERYHTTPNYFYDGNEAYCWFRESVFEPLERQFRGQNHIEDDGTELGKFKVAAFREFRDSVNRYWQEEYPVAFTKVGNSRGSNPIVNPNERTERSVENMV
ncbi:uncharacterized protein NDAI_0G02270 [Naumovozyma dairenensis CBS 421]|uniref:Uncharacterized protein n=1 Tax=Naumovozyma dairenensis (strain ATCC 10597 / BCRC 20456 / CBS 421 / NBRC 0211 / NRRL Y-12639) TaxID=1071378 RepID=G0WDZ1_NAUDC|nr:hypothetical protein NDAI_0G02270 [Naumovozyma dairenensis CBS 421]CCD26002.2 hypothetical protein NDAI_0G02270 [Naumovozyma dairenensis CBS 421]